MKPGSFDLLTILTAVAESENFRRAGERLGLSQPAVSVKLKELEALHPLPLFTFEGKKKVLTPYGRTLYEVARTGIADLELKIESVHRHYSTAERLTVRIGGRKEILEYLMPTLSFPGRLELITLSSPEAVRRLLRHEIDIAISHIIPDSTEIHAKKLMTSKAHLVIHEKLLGKRKLDRQLAQDKRFLSETPCISYFRDGHLIRDWAQRARLRFDELNVRYVVEDWGLVRDLVEKGVGFGILPSYVKTSASVRRLELFGEQIKDLEFYLLYERSLRKYPGFASLLSARW